MSHDSKPAAQPAAPPTTTTVAPHPPATAASSHRSSPRQPQSTNVVTSLDEEDILHPSYVRLSTMPSAPRPVMASRHALRSNMDVPGPGEYFKDLSWNRGTAKMASETIGNPKKKERTLDVPYYEIKLDKGPAFKIAGRLSDLTDSSRRKVPGPGEYDLAPLELSYKTATLKESLPPNHCSFGSPHKAKKPSTVPGPGAYDIVQINKVDRSPRGAVLTSRCPPLKPANVPGPGSYDPPSCFSARHGELGITMKGRLPYAANDRLAAHDCARTDHFHDPSKKFKSAPRLK